MKIEITVFINNSITKVGLVDTEFESIETYVKDLYDRLEEGIFVMSNGMDVFSIPVDIFKQSIVSFTEKVQ